MRIVARSLAMGLVWGAGIGAAAGLVTITAVLVFMVFALPPLIFYLPLLPFCTVPGLVAGGAWGAAVGAIAGLAGGVALATFPAAFRYRPNLARLVTAPVVALTAFAAAPWPIEFVRDHRVDAWLGNPALPVAWGVVAVFALAAWVPYAPEVLDDPAVPIDPRPHITIVPRLPG